MAGTTQFPVALDTFPVIGPNTSESAVGVEHDVVHENVHAAVVALQAKVGITGSVDPSSIDARLAEAASDIDLLADAQLAHQADADPHPQYLASAEADAVADARIEAQKGVALGLVPLNSAAQIDSAYIPTSVLGQVEYKGVWNASLGTAPDTAPEKGWYYVVTVAGSTSLGGIAEWAVGDWAIHNGVAWDKVDNTDAIASWNGRTGAVVPQAGDYTAEQVGADPVGTAAAIVTQMIAAGDTAHAPSGGMVFDALALKFDKTGGAISGLTEFAGTVANGQIRFTGSPGGAGEGFVYTDSGGGLRFGFFFPGSDIVAVGNRAANGTVHLRANTATAGGGGEVTTAIVRSAGLVSGADDARTLGGLGERWSNVFGTNIRPGAGTAIWTSGTGSPNGAVTAPVGSLFTRTDGGAGTTLYVKESGAGNTGWVAK